MTHASSLRDQLPIATPGLKRRPDFGVEVLVHGASLSKFCDVGKQHFASHLPQSSEVERKTLNQVLAEALSALMADKWNQSSLGKASGVAPNTIANYLKGSASDFTSKGKEKSATLANVELLAKALGVSPVMLLMSNAERAELAMEALRSIAATAQPAAAAPVQSGGESTPSDHGDLNGKKAA